jgi:hypothetical protein
MAEKKGIYHSELRKAGPVRVTVEAEAQESTKKKGSYYVTLKINGQTRYYNPENQACMDFFDGTKGQTFTIIADGGGKGQEDTATIEYVGEQISEAKPKTNAPPNRAPAPSSAAPRGPTPHNTASPTRPATRPPAQIGIHGATVGMAIKEAVRHACAAGELWNPEAIYERASDLIRLAQALESGRLAPKFSERTPSPENDGR